MLGAAVIVFRETLEAAMIIGIIAAATQGLPNRNRTLAAGLLAGLAGALMVAGLTDRIAELAEGTGQELFNAAVLALAVGMLGWHNIWMARHGRELAANAKKVGTGVRDGTQELTAIGIVVALAVLREGAETALFLYGLFASGEGSPASMAFGGLIGIAAGAACGVALYAGFMRVPTRVFFAATGTLILMLAASMAAQMARFLVQADLLPSLVSPLWDVSGTLPTTSTLGALLHTLTGYEASPSGMQVVFYGATFIVILVGMRLARPAPPIYSTVTAS